MSLQLLKPLAHRTHTIFKSKKCQNNLVDKQTRKFSSFGTISDFKATSLQQRAFLRNITKINDIELNFRSQRSCWTTSKQASKLSGSIPPSPLNPDSPFESHNKNYGSNSSRDKAKDSKRYSGPDYDDFGQIDFSRNPDWKKYLKFGLGLSFAYLTWYLFNSANTNPSFWYKSETKAPYVVTRDGRKIAYNEYGNHLGQNVVIVLHDYLSGRTELEGLQLVDKQLLDEKYPNMRIIIMDRPGYGQSDKQKHRKITDYPEEVLTVVDSLGIQKFSIIGIGAGGLYALACASQILPAHPGRIQKIALLSSEAPRLDKYGMTIPTTMQDQTREQRIQDFLHHGSYFVNGLLKLSNILIYSTNSPSWVFSMLYGSEVKVLESRSKLYETLVKATREAWMQGFQMVRQELSVTKDRSIQLGLSSINLPKGERVVMWHGQRDELVPIHVVEQLHYDIPNAKLNVCQSGHLGTIIHNWNNVLDHVYTPSSEERQKTQGETK